MSVAESEIPESLAAAGVSSEEWDLRERLAAAYHIVDFLGWSESIYGHITLKLPGGAGHFLINPYGLRYDEVTAENLVKIDLAGGGEVRLDSQSSKQVILKSVGRFGFEYRGD